MNIEDLNRYSRLVAEHYQALLPTLDADYRRGGENEFERFVVNNRQQITDAINHGRWGRMNEILATYGGDMNRPPMREFNNHCREAALYSSQIHQQVEAELTGRGRTQAQADTFTNNLVQALRTNASFQTVELSAVTSDPNRDERAVFSALKSGTDEVQAASAGLGTVTPTTSRITQATTGQADVVRTTRNVREN